MSVMNKPDYKIFAQDAKSGEYVAFPDILRGWGITLDQYNGFPPMELFNSAAKRIDEWLMYLTQRGLPEWDAVVDYPKDAMIQHSGVYYVSLKATKDEQPNNSQASWKKLTEVLGVDGKLAKDQNGADIPDKEKFIENLGLPEKYQPKGDYADGESFSVLELESRMLSPDGSIAMLANNNKASGVWDETAQRLLWGFDSAGKLTHGTIPMDRTSGFGTAAAKNTGNGTGQIPDMSYFPFSGKGTDSIVVTLPNGLIIQSFKREVVSSVNVGEGNTTPINFPAAFPNKAVAVVCTKSSYVQIAISCENKTLSGFSAVAMKVVPVDVTYSMADFIVLGY